MNTTTIIVIAVIVVIALAVLFLVRGRKQHVTFSDRTPPLTRTAAPAPKPVEAAPPAPAVPPVESHSVATEIADAVEDVVDQFVGIDSHPTAAPAKGPGDTLTQLKGLGPKAASILNDLGVTRFEQIGSWNDADVDAIDAQMGAFKGRIRRDRWVDQAKLLAKGDTAAFETEFGALGS
jgi:predicted flap endonuclease-1-like 5' DNA nuclease